MPVAPKFWRDRRSLTSIVKRLLATPADSIHPLKDTGDISSVFPSLKSDNLPSPLPPRFVDLKKRLISGHEDHVEDSWHRLLADLRKEIEIIKNLGSAVIPEVEFKDMHDIVKRTKFRDQLHKRGVAIIRGVVTEREALGWKDLLRRYIQDNPSTKGTECIRLYSVSICALNIAFSWQQQETFHSSNFSSPNPLSDSIFSELSQSDIPVSCFLRISSRKPSSLRTLLVSLKFSLAPIQISSEHKHS